MTRKEESNFERILGGEYQKANYSPPVLHANDHAQKPVQPQPEPLSDARVGRIAAVGTSAVIGYLMALVGKAIVFAICLFLIIILQWTPWGLSTTGVIAAAIIGVVWYSYALFNKWKAAKAKREAMERSR